MVMRFALLLLCVTPFARAQIGGCRDSIGRTIGEGETLRVQSTVFRCRSGELMVEGCSVEDGRTVDLGQTIRGDGYELTCEQVSPTVGYLTPTACVYDNRVIRRGESVKTEYFVFTCRGQNGGVNLDVTACVDENGGELVPGQQVSRGEFQYQCSLSDGYIRLVPVGCLYDGAEYEAGSTFDGAKFWFSCVVENNAITRRIEGCLDRRGNRIRPGSTFHRNEFLVSCEARANGIVTKVVGCLQKLPNGETLEHRVGTNWMEGSHPFQYKVYCTTCSNGSTVYKSTTKCKVGGSSKLSGLRSFGAKSTEASELQPGCIRSSGNRLSCCGTAAGGRLQGFTERNTPANLDKLRRRGFRLCE